uniref:Uncharacterized protein n=1 Tax=Candidatus Kentrum sp. LPFa TaxID=2126335 RepID=A0A450Y205_9GAMM|nr:MAG: hypothetical protein BECKLPF1236A_GA0070988_103656 [Candidatus Kentron sp. LPFa]VFK35573.1 MAG: hypothetical protein BECKLPF1236C_GA0070990_103936 [Candidatus Kentron sp. LPFa]
MRLNIRALVDSGAYMLSINDETKTQLDLAILDKQMVEPPCVRIVIR